MEWWRGRGKPKFVFSKGKKMKNLPDSPYNNLHKSRISFLSSISPLLVLEGALVPQLSGYFFLTFSFLLPNGLDPLPFFDAMPYSIFRTYTGTGIWLNKLQNKIVICGHEQGSLKKLLQIFKFIIF